MEGLLKDLRHAARRLRKNPGFALVSTVTIALGIGACTAIFSVVNAVLLRPLPYSEPEQLVLVWGELRARGVKDWPFSPPDYRDVRRQATAVFEDVAAVMGGGRAPLSEETGEPESIRLAAATPNLFRVLGARVILGRDFVEEDALPPPRAAEGAAPAAGPPPVRLPQIAILSHGLWQRRFGGDRSVIGRQVNVGMGRAQIVGVLSPDFELLFAPRVNVERVPDMWTAARIDYEAASRNNVGLRPIARLRSGVSIERASAEVERIATELRKQFPIKESSGLHFRAVSMYEDLVSGVRRSILALMAAVLFVLLIACANVANLLIVRASTQRRDLAVRAAMGASRGHLLRESLAEALVIAGLGTLAGLALARGGIKVLLALGPKNLPRIDGVSMDPRVLVFAVCAGFVTALACGIVPGLRASRTDVVDALRSSGPVGGLRGARRLRSGVVIAEVALSFILLIGAGLMLRSVLALTRVNPGYDPTSVLTFLAGPQAPQPAQRAAFMTEVRGRLLGIRGVVSVTAASSVPLDGGLANVRWGTEAALTNPSTFRQADLKYILPGYFDTLRTRLLAGRVFSEADNRLVGPQAPRLAVIDDAVAARAFPNQPAVGRRLLIRTVNNPEAEWWEVIGVVAHQRHVSLTDDGPEAIFIADGFFGHGLARRWVVRTTGDPASYVPAVRAAVAAVDRHATLAEVQPMMALVDKAMAPMRYTAALMALFAIVALVLAAVGLYGVLSTIVRQRTAEIGMRMVFGAQRSHILGLVVGEGLKLAAVGIVIGVGGALAITRLMSSMLVGVGATDALTFFAIVGLFAVVAAAASWVPARRASQLDPIDTIREQG